MTTIGQAAAAAGLTRKAVRLYEERVERLRFIAAARSLGLHVDQVAEILGAAHDGQRPCATTHRMLDERIAQIDRVIGERSTLRAALTAARERPATGDAAICPVVEAEDHDRPGRSATR